MSIILKAIKTENSGFSLIAYENYCLHLSLKYDRFQVLLDSIHCIFLMERFYFQYFQPIFQIISNAN